MKRLTALLLIILALFPLFATTVSLGVEAGADYNMVISGKGYRNYTYSNKIGIMATVPVLVEFTPSLGLETGISYYMKNYGYSRTVTDGETSVKTLDYDRYNHFIEIPVGFHYTYAIPMSSTLSLMASAGGFIGFWVYGSRAGYAYSVSNNPELTHFNQRTDLDNYNIFQAGVYATLGGKWQFSRTTDVYVRAGYYLTLTDLNKPQKYGGHPAHNSTITLTAGIMWRVNG